MNIKTTHTRAAALILTALIALPALSAAADDANAPTTQPAQSDSPATQPARRPFAARSGPGIALWSRLFGNGSATAGPPATPAERTDAAEFLRAHSPNKAALLDKLRPATRDLVLNVVVVRCRQIKRFQTTDPDLYNLLIQQFEAQDQVLGAMEQVGGLNPTTAPAATPADADQALRDKIAALVDLNLQQRQARLDRLKETLASEEDRLARDTANKDELIERAFERAVADADRLAQRLGNLPSSQPPPANVANQGTPPQAKPDTQDEPAPTPDADVMTTKSPPTHH